MGAITKKDEREIKRILKNLYVEIDSKRSFSVSGLCILLEHIEKKVAKATRENMRLAISEQLWQLQQSLEKEAANITKLQVKLM